MADTASLLIELLTEELPPKSLRQLSERFSAAILEGLASHQWLDRIDAQDYNTIGNKYGDIYELQFKIAQNARINKHVVPPFFANYMRPTMAMQTAKL